MEKKYYIRRRVAALAVVGLIAAGAASAFKDEVHAVSKEDIIGYTRTLTEFKLDKKFKFNVKVETPTAIVNSLEAKVLAKIAWGEARGLSKTEQACVMWTILNRADAWGKSVYDIATEPNQFYYVYSAPTIDDFGNDLVELAIDVLAQHWLEQNDYPANRCLPSDYLWYFGDGEHNYFYNHFPCVGEHWDYTLYNYEEEE